MIHSDSSEHDLLPEYMPVSKTRTKRGTRVGMSVALLARLETMVEEQDLCDINHAFEVLVGEGADEAEEGQDYTWSINEQRTVAYAERSKRIREAMNDE